MAVRDSVEGIEIPIIEIADGWTVDDIETEDDCDDAYAYLVSAVAAIEYQLDMFVINPEAHTLGRDPTWAPRARAALRMKRAALQIVQNTRGRIDRKRRQTERANFLQTFADMVREEEPQKFAIWRDLAISRTQRATQPEPKATP